jgi:hypothetical protein
MDPEKRGALETNMVRDKAEALIERLYQTRSAFERQARHNSCLTPDRAESARHTVDQAIESTQRMIDQLNRAMHHLGLDEQAPPDEWREAA